VVDTLSSKYIHDSTMKRLKMRPQTPKIVSIRSKKKFEKRNVLNK